MAPSKDKKPSRFKAAIAKKTEALNNPVKMADMPLLVRLLWKNQNVFSKSWLRDWFVVFKNRHAFFSVFLCHPQHPFSWKERFVLILCVLMFGYALATAAEVALTRAEEIALENVKGDEEETAKAYEKYRDFKDKNGATVTLFGSIIVQAFYDTFAKWFFICGCAEMTCVTKRSKMKKCCDFTGHFIGCLVFTIALCCALFTLYMNTPEYRGDAVEISCANASVVPNKTATPPEMCALDMAAAMKTFGYARLISFLGSTTGVLTVMFMVKRQIKIPCKHGEMLKLKADKTPSDDHRVRKKQGDSLVDKITRLSTKDETDEEFNARRDENEWRFPTYDELGPHPPLEPSIFSNTVKCCQNKIATTDVKEGEEVEHKEYYVGGEWVGWSEVKETSVLPDKPGNTKAPPKKGKKGNKIAPTVAE